MDTNLSYQLNDCLRLVNRLGDQVQESEDSISFCVSGDIRKAYLDNCALAATRIDEIKCGIQALYAEIERYEQQML